MSLSLSSAPSLVGSLLFGVGAWTLAEYLLHRFVMHELRGVGLPSREHLLHHADPEQNTGRPVLSWVGIAVIGALLFLPAVSVFVGLSSAFAVYGGWLCGYGIYRRIHNRSHSHPPHSSYGRWVRTHHFHHHYGHPMANHGVTSPLWDRVFGTLEVSATVRVPRRHVMPWLVDADGALRPQYADHYEIVESSRDGGRLAGIDRARAFANLAPHLGRPT